MAMPGFGEVVAMQSTSSSWSCQRTDQLSARGSNISDFALEAQPPAQQAEPVQEAFLQEEE
jgi:hypothetical protein